MVKDMKWRKWATVEEMSNEDYRETLVIQAICLPAALGRHEEDNNG